ncbi:MULTISPECIES: hypothetical protein [Pseudomonas]|uniref:hypothetical protein n=1 Tax=Pseudomonas TaxID=286 RepID=UPI00211A4971|nr:hypothetical protein [Pseudomonas shahriarae]MCQ9178430.1 hypothetical protein [Streptomyces hayashii]MDD1133793.1 hypothetical protein [Pseudomonas shahriarae]MEA3172412.1 hypothetical protein [Pseudomonas sp.]
MAKTLPIRLNDDQEARLEQAAALAGYKHLSTYVRDRALASEKSGGRQTDLDSWADQQRVLGLLENVSQAQAQNRTLLTIAVHLLRQGLQQGKVNELRAELSHLADTDQLIRTLLPELASDIERLSGEDNA